MKNKLSKGFTLIELMVVIVIIGIIIAIALPNFVAAQNRAKVSSVKANAKVLQTIIEAYNIDNGFYTNSISEITGSKAYKIFKNPVTGFSDVADLTGKGAWRTNNDGAVGSPLTSYGDGPVSKGLVLYVGLNINGDATTHFTGNGSLVATPPETVSYLIYGCDETGQPIKRFILSAGVLTPEAQAFSTQ